MLKAKTRWPGFAWIGALAMMAVGVFADPIPAGRRIDWSGAGTNVPSGSWAIGTNLTGHIDATGATDVSAAINDAISKCTVPGVVLLPAGTLNFSNQVLITRNGIALRGMGPSNTVVKANCNNPVIELCPVGGEFYRNLDQNVTNAVNITNGLAKGSYMLTIDPTTQTGLTPLAVGMDVMVDQLNDGWMMSNNGNEGPCTGCSRANGTRGMGQLAIVTNIVGNVVYIDNPLCFWYTNSLVPQLFWWSVQSVRNSGVESLQVDDAGALNAPNNTHTVQFYGADGCWAYDVQTENADRSHFLLSWAYRCQIEHCYMTLSRSVGSQSYGIEMSATPTACAVINNIGFNLSAPLTMGWGATENVVAFNYLTNVTASTSTVMPEALDIHDVGNMMNLFEGNYTPSIFLDDIHGSCAYETFFRNRSLGWQWMGITYQGYALSVNAQCRFGNYVGNCFGTTNQSPVWIITNAVANPSTLAIYVFGYTNHVDSLTGYDPASFSTSILHGNWDSVTNGVNWDPTIVDHALPDSYWLASKPAWWGDRRWPVFEPTTATLATMDPTNLPAGYRFIYGVDPPAGAQPPATTNSGVVIQGTAVIGGTVLVQ